MTAATMDGEGRRVLRTGLIVSIGFGLAASAGLVHVFLSVAILVGTGVVAGARPRPHGGGIIVGGFVGGLLIDLVALIGTHPTVEGLSWFMSGLPYALGVGWILSFALVFPGYLLGRAFIKETDAVMGVAPAEGASPIVLASSGVGLLVVFVVLSLWFLSNLRFGP